MQPDTLPPDQIISALRTLYRIPSDIDTITGLHATLKFYSENRQIPTWQTAWEVVQQCEKTEDPLLAFAAWYTSWINGNLIFAQHFGVTETKLGTGLVLFRLGQFQVQLFTFRPGAVIVPHTHPDVDSYEVYVCGDMALTKQGVDQVIREFAVPDERGICLSNGAMIRIPAGCLHGGLVRSGPAREGGAFLSVQRWKDGIKPYSIQYNWEGEDGSEQG